MRGRRGTRKTSMTCYRRSRVERQRARRNSRAAGGRRGASAERSYKGPCLRARVLIAVSALPGTQAAVLTDSVVSTMEALRIGEPLDSTELKGDVDDTAEEDNEEEHDLECAVCLCRLSAFNGPGPQLLCKHTYHSDCLDHWLRTCEAKGHPLLCPTCRQPVLFEEL